MAETAVIVVDPTPAQVIAWTENVLEYLELVETPREAEQIQNQAKALAYLAQKAGMIREIEQQATEVVVRAMIRSGKITKAVDRPHTGRGNPPHLGEIQGWVRDHHQAVSRNEAVAGIDEDKREAFIAAQRAKGTLSQAGLERYGRNLEAEAKRIEAARRNPPPVDLSIDIRCGDFREVLAEVHGVDAVITDPPYGMDFLKLLPDLASWADSAMTKDGVLAVLFGQTHLPSAYALLAGHRPYRWTMAYLTPGAGYVSHASRVQSSWKPILVYGGGPRLGDLVTSERDSSKEQHKWGQDYVGFHTLVARLTEPGQTVADPFAGAGTTLLAAVALGRHVVGAEVDPEHFDTMHRRFGR